MAPPQWLSRRTSSGLTDTSDNFSQLENGTEMANLRPQRERSDRILREIHEGRQVTLHRHSNSTPLTATSHNCSICLDPVTLADVREHKFWHCRDCYNTFHFQCVQGVNSRPLSGAWQCPYCRATQVRLTRALCWCGARPEVCNGHCGRREVCPHGEFKTCWKACHPGACVVPCSNRCANLPPTPQVLAVPSLRQSFSDKWRKTQGYKTEIAVLFAPFAVLYGLVIALAVYDIKWTIEPYKYPNFATQWDDWGILPKILLVPFYIGPLGVLLFALGMQIAKMLVAVLSLDSLETKPRTKKFAKVSGAIMMGLMFVVLILLPVVCFFGGGSDVAWYNQMKDSCKGFNTRINMDGGDHALEERFKMHSFTPKVEDQELFLAPRLKPNTRSNGNTKTFQYFYRLSGSTDKTKNIAVDVDIENRAWRLMKFNATDLENKWLAYDYRHHAKIPTFSNTDFKIIENGTFSSVSKEHNHMHIYGLDMDISNMNLFLDNTIHEPFLRVYDTRDLGEDQIKTLLDKEWSSNSDSRVIMRTASFGHGRQDLDMCVKESEGYQAELDGGLPIPRYWSGIDDRNLVPFAIVSAYRAKLYREKQPKQN
ncbi:uncharacterized protein PAC_15341 [Phialocephala subalpina]|uniref:PHD-type domain-containing protein n=1 Tax=Phialocephala subalpina TaxID=576137 RepID=A0A1L7XK58_9HELO|nr:uncharacterized protein PAC_15341 [Phialocephala subalpina]